METYVENVFTPVFHSCTGPRPQARQNTDPIKCLAGEVPLTADNHPTLSLNSDLTKPLPGFILSQYRGTGTQSQLASLCYHREVWTC